MSGIAGRVVIAAATGEQCEDDDQSHRPCLSRTRGYELANSAKRPRLRSRAFASQPEPFTSDE